MVLMFIFVLIIVVVPTGPGNVWDALKQDRPDGEYHERTQGALDFLSILGQQNADIPAGTSVDEWYLCSYSYS
jgi:hypothetical protein